MKHNTIMVALVATMIVLLVAIASMLPVTEAATQRSAVQIAQRKSQDRIVEAEYITNRMTARVGKMIALCNHVRLPETCNAHLALYSKLETIRDVAAESDDVKWAQAKTQFINIMHKYEEDTEPALRLLNAVERK
jgi:hypothetical protein